MRPPTLILAFIIFCQFQPLFANNWIPRSTPTLEDLYDVYFATTDSGWAVGDNGTVLFSANGGETWTSQNTPIPQDLRGVYFLNRNTGWIVGLNGTVFYTTNSGQTWLGKVISDLTNDLGFITFANDNHGWLLATGSPYDKNLTATSNGGDTWQVGQGPVVNKLYSMNTFGPDTLWLTSVNGGAFYSTDGGTTWENRDTGLEGHLYSIAFMDTLTGWVSNDRGRIWHTTDGGFTWNEQATPLSGQSAAHIYRLAFADSMNGWGASNRGILYTTDGGTNWSLKSSIRARSLMFHSKAHGWAVGDDGKIWEYRAVDENVVADSTFLDQLMVDTFHWIQNSNEAHLPFDWTYYGINSVGHCCSVAEIGLYMVSLLGASQYPDLLTVTEQEAHTAVNATLDQLFAWQSGSQEYQPNGPNTWNDSLFFKWYITNASPPTVGSEPFDDPNKQDQDVPCLDNAWLAASLLAVRGYCFQNPALGDTSRIYTKCDSILRRMNFLRWYDSASKRFHAGSYHDPTTGTTFDYLSDESRLVNFITRVLDAIYGPGPYSPNEFRESYSSLFQESASYDGITVEFVSFDGSYSNYAAPCLFLREQDSHYLSVIDSATKIQMQYQQNQGYPFWGISDCFVSGVLSPRGCPPRGSNNASQNPDDGNITPYASALGLNSSFSQSALNNLYRIQYVYPSSYDPDYGFTDSIDLNTQMASGFAHGLSQFRIFLSILNYKDETVWKFFYANPEVEQVHTEYVAVVPVELAAFSAHLKEGKVHLHWSTLSETDNYGFEIERGNQDHEFFAIGFVQGIGTSNQNQSYNFIDTEPLQPVSHYRLKQIDQDGGISYSPQISVQVSLPKSIDLLPCYPNPCNATITITFLLANDEKVEIAIFNILGDKVTELFNANKPAGKHIIKWDGTNQSIRPVSSGIYFVRLNAGQKYLDRKILILK